MIAFFIHIPLLLLLSWLLYTRSAGQPLHTFFWWALSAKILAGISIGWLYLYYFPYQGDTFAYFDDAARLAAFAKQEPSMYVKVLFFPISGAESFLATLPLWEQPRAFFMVKLVSILCLFTFSNYWLCGMYLSLFCFYALWKVANLLAQLFPESFMAAAIAFLLLPSVVFWSAGLTKESIAIACIACIVSHFIQYKFAAALSGKAPTLLSWILLPVYVFLLWNLKYYYLAALLPALLAYIVTDLLTKHSLADNRLGLQAGILIFIFGSILLGASFLHPSLHLSHFLESLIINHDLTVQLSAPESMIYFHELQATPNSVIEHLPKALFSGLYRPLVWEANTLFQIYIGLENVGLLMLTIFVLCYRRNQPIKLSRSYSLLAIAAALYSVLMAALLALSSPNFGALSRYKVAFMPFFVYLLLSVVLAGKTGKQNLVEKQPI